MGDHARDATKTINPERSLISRVRELAVTHIQYQVRFIQAPPTSLERRKRLNSIPVGDMIKMEGVVRVHDLFVAALFG